MQKVNMFVAFSFTICKRAARAERAVFSVLTYFLHQNNYNSL